jgi:hypothetical protein
MIFESGEYIVIAPLDPSEGRRHVEPAMDNIITEYMNQLYRTTACEYDYIKPNADGMLNWRSIIYCASDSNIGLEN